MKKSLETAIKIRKFNRFYLPYFHLLAQKYLNTEYSMAEARILYEIYESGEISARDIVSKLHVDKSYLSRILKKFEANAFIERERPSDHSRRTLIHLTESGKALAESLIAESNDQVEKNIAGISDHDLDKLSCHLEKIIEILGGKNEDHGV